MSHHASSTPEPAPRVYTRRSAGLSRLSWQHDRVGENLTGDTDASAPADCLFCKIVAGDIPGDVVHETERTVAFRDLNPQAPTHVLVVPRDHYPNAAALAAGDPQASAELVCAAAAVAAARGPRRLPAGLQHRRRGRPDRVPHPPARARRPADDLAAGMTAGCAPALPRALAAAAATVLLAACGLGDSGGDAARPGGRLGRARPRPPAPRRRPTPTRPHGHGPRGRRRQPHPAEAAARGGEAGDAGDAGALHALGAHRRRHRRLPLLPARPEARRGRLPHRHQRAARATPTWCTTSSCSACRRTRSREAEPIDAADAGPGLDLLRRHRRRPADPASSTTRRGSAPGPRAASEPCTARASAPGSAKGTQVVMQVHYNLLAGDDARHLAPPSCGSRPADAELTPAARRCCCRRRSSCPAGPSTTTARCATATAAIGGRQGPLRRRSPGPPPTCSTSCAAAEPAAGEHDVVHPDDQPADDDPRPSPATCTCSAARSGSRSTPARPGRGRCSTSRSGTSTTREPGRSSRCSSKPGDTVKVTCRHVQWLRDQLPVVRGPAGAVRRVGRGHHRRDVPRHPAGHPSLTWALRPPAARNMEVARTPTGRPPAWASMTDSAPAPRDRSVPHATRHTVVVPNSINMVSLLGPGDEHLALIEQAFDADVHVRGNRITLHGEPARGRPRRAAARRAGDDHPHRPGRHHRDRRAGARDAARGDHRAPGRRAVPQHPVQPRPHDPAQDAEPEALRRLDRQAHDHLRHRPRRHRQDLPGDGQGRAGAAGQEGQPDHPDPPGGRGGRAARLPARHAQREDRPLPAAAVRRAARHDRPRDDPQAAGGRDHRGRPAGLHARPDAQRRVHHPRRGAEHLARADEDVPDPARLRLQDRGHRRRHPGRPAQRHRSPACGSSRGSSTASRTSSSTGSPATTSSGTGWSARSSRRTTSSTPAASATAGTPDARAAASEHRGAQRVRARARRPAARRR